MDQKRQADAQKDQPMFRLMSYYELTAYNQKAVDTKNPEKYLYLVVSAEPYENIAMAIPNRPIIKPDMDQMSDDYWWYWDHDTKEFVVQIVYKWEKEKERKEESKEEEPKVKLLMVNSILIFSVRPAYCHPHLTSLFPNNRCNER